MLTSDYAITSHLHIINSFNSQHIFEEFENLDDYAIVAESKREWKDVLEKFGLKVAKLIYSLFILF